MSNSTNKPNIFNYATKELSQDAVICWLIDWAYYKGEQEYERQLNQCGQKFIGSLFSKHGKEAPKNPGKVKIWRQYNGIDVLVDIGEYVLLIEDKIDGEPDEKQLTRYYKKVVQMIKDETVLMDKSEEDILPIFLKTGNHSLYEQLIEVEHSLPPYKVFDRGDFLKVVEDYSAAYPILDDFTARLKCWDRATKSFKNWDQAKEWEYTACQGFFRELENHLTVSDSNIGLVGFDDRPNIKRITEENNWGRSSADAPPWWKWKLVNPPNGDAFAGFSWYCKTMQSCGHDVDIYLQLEIKLAKPDKPDKPSYRKLCFKVIDYTGLDMYRKQIQQDCYQRILKAGNGLLCRPNVMRTGNTMTVAQWDDKWKDRSKQNPWLVFNKTGVGPDIQETVNNLIKAQHILDRVG